MNDKGKNQLIQYMHYQKWNKKKCEKSCMYKGEKKTDTYYRTNIQGAGDEIPCIIPRKKGEKRKSQVSFPQFWLIE